MHTVCCVLSQLSKCRFQVYVIALLHHHWGNRIMRNEAIVPKPMVQLWILYSYSSGKFAKNCHYKKKTKKKHTNKNKQTKKTLKTVHFIGNRMFYQYTDLVLFIKANNRPQLWYIVLIYCTVLLHSYRSRTGSTIMNYTKRIYSVQT